MSAQRARARSLGSPSRNPRPSLISAEKERRWEAGAGVSRAGLDAANAANTVSYGYDALDRLTAATLPSYRTIAPPGPRRSPTAGDVFRWMHQAGWLTYWMFAFRRR